MLRAAKFMVLAALFLALAWWVGSLPGDVTARAKLQEQWSALFREWDLVLCPPMPTPAFLHEHSTPISARHVEINGKEYPYFDQMVWPGVATTPRLPSTAAPIGTGCSGSSCSPGWR